ncbi:MAG: RNA 3'-phosphate cyclase [Candidatus Aenigmarchaeota archaeon]|nr:RNA 3'-phosphate cyclase [Candidatus Aenigmarchaeota archaeon]
MIEIDGITAGGQLLRTAAALSVLTGKPFKIINIRGARPQSGLKAQHMEVIKALGKLCNAEITGLELGSEEIEFIPNKFVEKDLTIKIPTAGSIGLLLNALLIATYNKSIKIKVYGGGTWNKWAPPVLYLKKVLFPLIGEKTEINIIRDGFYPQGGAEVEVISKPFEINKIDILRRGEIKEINGYSIASSILKKNKVAERQKECAEKLLKKEFQVPINIQISYVDSISPGSGILLVMKTENSIIGADCVGEKGKSSENIATEAVNNLIFESRKAGVDKHAGDMLLPYIALAGKGRYKTSMITNHTISNADIVNRFLDVKIRIIGDQGGMGIISLS